MQTIPLQQAIEQAKANPTSDFAKQLRSAIESGQLDQAAAKQGVDLTKYGRPVQEQNVFEKTLSNVKEFVKNPIDVGKERLQNIAPSQRDFDILYGRVNATPEEVASAKDKFLSSAMSFSPGGLEKSISGVTEPIKKIAKSGSDVVSNTAKNIVPKTKDTFINFISPEIDDAVKNSLKKTSTQKFDEYVTAAEQAAQDQTAPSVYEKVASSIEDATLQIDKQVKSLSNQKKQIINKAKTGLADFSKETGKTILDINKSLKDSTVAKSFIDKLKNVKTKLDADNAIDEMQDILYRGNKDMTIPVGSKEDSILKSIVGKYNSELKSSLPKSYSNINDEIAARLSTLDTLNQSLGQVVDGAPIRGAGLVKQFFSPAGTKTKQLFGFIKKTTGIDIAQEATLAKYVGEAFGDIKTRSLLEGVPTSHSGALQKVIDFAVDKIGATKKLSEIKKAGMLEKARKITVEAPK